MMRWNLSWALLLASVFCFASAAGTGQQVFRGGSDAVRVFVTVTDRDGRLVTNLTRDNFEVRDDGKAQPLTQYDASPQPISLIVMLDVSGSMEGNLSLLRDASTQLFSRLLPEDQARVGVFRRGRQDQPGVHPQRRRAPGGAAHEDCAGCAHTTLARPGRRARRIWRYRPLAQGDSRVERRQGQRTHRLSLTARESSRRDRSGAARRCDDLRDRTAQSRARPATPGIGPGGLQAMLLSDLPTLAWHGSLKRPAEATSKSGLARISVRPSPASPMNSTRSICLDLPRPGATARPTRSTCGSTKVD